MARRRSVRGLKKASLIETPSFTNGYSYQTSAMLQGLRFEKNIKNFLSEAYDERAKVLPGQWFEFEDIRGRGFAQPDVILLPPQGHLLIVEVKLTWRPGVERKLRRFYGPLCEQIWPDLKQKHVQICRGLKKNCSVETWFDIEDMLNPDNPDYMDVHHII